MNRLFQQLVHGSKRANRIVCGKCGVGALVYCSSVKSSSPEPLAKKFQKMGWTVGKSAAADRCPACQTKTPRLRDLAKKASANGRDAADQFIREANRLGATIKWDGNERISLVPSANVPFPPGFIEKGRELRQSIIDVHRQNIGLNSSWLEKAREHEQKRKESEYMDKLRAEPPQEMSREDRRCVFEKLNEVYLDEDHGYGDGWSDERVAKDLGVPRAWVSKIRDENCGPEVGPKAKANFAEEARKILDEARAEISKGAVQIGTVSAQQSVVLKKIEKLEERISAFAKKAA